ncbi:MAG: hypothetical protein IJW79_01675 [Clostridia bacterium]|nr:hypothetical protein [Clostridia bacterium]
MKITKTNSILRFACALLAVLTVVVSLPLFAVESKAEGETAAISHSVDFSAGTVDTALSANPTINGVTFSNFQGAPKYATKDGKTVLYGSNACFYTATDVPALIGTKYFVEIRFNIAAAGTAEMCLIGTSMMPSETASVTDYATLRLKPDLSFEMRNSETSSSADKYDDTTAQIGLGEWHTVKLVVDEPTSTVELYLDGDFKHSITTVDAYSLAKFRFMHNKSGWQWNIDTISYGVVEEDSTISHSLDFSSGMVGAALSAAPTINGVKLGSTAGTVPVYATIVEDEKERTVLSGANGCFTVTTDVPDLAGTKFFVETKLNVTQLGTESLSLIALNLKTSSTATSAATPLVRLTVDETLEMRGSDSKYVSTETTMSLNAWHTVKVVVDTSTKMVELYLDGELVKELAMVNIYSMSSIRFMHNKSGSTWYMDTVRYGVGDGNVESGETPEEPVEPEEPKVPIMDSALYNEYISFENFTNDEVVTSDAILATETVSADRLSKIGGLSGVKAKADPDNAENMVSYLDDGQYVLHLYEKDIKLAGTSFVTSMDVRFSAFPVDAATGADKPTALLGWVYTTSSGTTNYMNFCRVDSKGNLLNKSNELTGFTFELNKWANIAVLCDGTTGEYDVFFNGEYVFSDDIGSPNTTNTTSYIRVLNKLNADNNPAKFSACVDNVMLYEAERTAPIEETDLIWDVDFESLATGTTMNKTAWNDLSEVADAFNVGTSSVYKVAEFNGGKALKVTNGTNNSQTDLYMGNGAFDPLKTDGLSFSFDFQLEEIGTGYTGLNHIVSWRRLDSAGTANAFRILSFNHSGKFVFLNNVLDMDVEVDKTYHIEIIFNSEKDTATLKIDGDVIVDSYPVLNYNTSTKAHSFLEGLNKSYFLDDAGVKHTLPYTSFVKSYLCDADGCQITDADGNPVFVDKLVANKNFYTDMLRLFQGATGSTADYYIDNIKAVKITPENIFSTDFSGWEYLDTNEYYTPTQENTDYRFEKEHATIIDDNGNTVVSLVSTNSTQKVFYPFGDRDMEYYGQELFFETKVKFVTKSDEAGSKTSFISFVEQRNSGVGPFGYDSSKTTYRHFLSRDEHGYLYTSNNTDPIGQLKYQDWTNIGIHIHGNGTKWVSYDVYIDGEFAATNTLAIAGDVQTYSFRIRTQYNEMWFDDFAVYYPKAEIEDLEIDFETKAGVEEAIVKLDGGWNYSVLDSTRTNTDGETVTSVQLLGEDGSKYLRVDHTKLRDSTSAYIDAVKDLFVDSDDFLIETSVRFTSETGATLNVAEIYKPMDKKSAPILAVRGGTNNMYIILRGVTYDLVTSSGQPIVAAQITDSEFTDIAILVDGIDNTYTLYVNGKIAYYVYNEKREPCADMPMHFIEKETDGVKDKVRLLEMSEYKYQDGILDVAYINLISLGNGIGSELKGTQTKTFFSENTYGVRFVSGIDSLYGGSIGYEITAVYTDKNGSQTKSGDKNSSLVFKKVSSDKNDITAESLDASYLAAIEVIDIPMETAVEFTVKPYVNHGGVKIYGKSYTVEFSQGAIVE